jgi:hypothetical protein
VEANWDRPPLVVADLFLRRDLLGVDQSPYAGSGTLGKPASAMASSRSS